MDITFITELINSLFSSGAVIVLACLCVGAMCKHWIPDGTFQNKFIPTVNTVLGGVLGVNIPTFYADEYFLTRIIYGAIVGLISCVVYDKVISAFSKGA